MEFKELGCKGIDWTDLDPDRFQWWAVMDTDKVSLG
jgi:hypothetical protein